MEATEVMVIEPPRGDVDAACQMCTYIRDRENEIMEAISKIEITAENYNSEDVKDSMRELSAAVEDVRNGGKKLIAKVLAETEALRIVTQIDPRLWKYTTRFEKDDLCTYRRLKTAYDNLKAKIDKFKKESVTPDRMHTYFYAITATDKSHASIRLAMGKYAEGECHWVSPQNDKAFNAMQKAFAMADDSEASHA